MDFPVYIVLYIAFLFLACALGFAMVAVARRPRILPPLGTRIRANFVYIAVLLLLFLALTLVNILSDYLQFLRLGDFTLGMYRLEGDTVGYIQSAMMNTYLTYFMIIVYLFIFAFALVFTPLVMLRENCGGALQKLSLSFLIVVAIVIPFYLFFPVYVTSYSYVNHDYLFTLASPAQPLLYNDVNAYILIRGVNTLGDSFPSVHTALIAVMFLTARRYTDLRGYSMFLFALLVLVPASSVYLGVHWLLDIIAGLLAGIFAYVLAHEPYLGGMYAKWAARMSSRLRVEGEAPRAFGA